MINNDIHANDISFSPGDQIEIYFPEEKAEYRFVVSSMVFEGYKDMLVVDLPNTLSNTFYKGEDFIQCKCVSQNVVYTFGGEIIKIVHGKNSYVIIKKPQNFQKETHRSKARVSTQLLCEYFVQKVDPGEYISRMQGFASIKDASIGGVSFLTTDSIPSNTILRMHLNNLNIVFDVEVMSMQRVNDKNFYGGKIINFLGDSEELFSRYLQSMLESSENQTFVGNIY